MSDYEMVVIVSPEIDEEGKSTVIDKLSQLISDKEGTVEETKQLGKKRLAYPIKGFVEGEYVLTQFKLDPRFVKELDDDIKDSGEIIRVLITKKSK
jgi:small subunit ribosomal protein S6